MEVHPAAGLIYGDQHQNLVEIGEKVAREYDVIFSSLPTDLFNQVFFVAENLLGKKLLNVWCPHGNSDKGRTTYFMEALGKEKIALVYGKKMIDFLVEKKVYNQLYATILLGNYRYAFYQSCQSYYEKRAEEEIFSKLPQGKPTLLYAPTWGDAEDSTSLFEDFPLLLDSLPESLNLFVKLHPNLYQNPAKLQPLLDKAEAEENVFIIKDFPQGWEWGVFTGNKCIE